MSQAGEGVSDRAGSGRAASADFLAISRRFLDALGAEGVGSEWEQADFRVDGREPRWVLVPRNLEEASRALALCSEAALAVQIAGGGARLPQGAPPERLDVVVSTARLDAVVAHAADDLTLTVQAGARLAAVNQQLAASGQWLPFDPPLAAETTIGGLVAAQAAGPSRLAFGTPRESILGMRAVLADGTVVKSGGRVVKNVAGYDLHRLLAGSFGTLALLEEVTFKLRPRAERTLALAVVGETEPLFRLALALADSGLEPQFLELLLGLGSRPTLVAGFGGTLPELAAAHRLVGELAAEAAMAPPSEISWPAVLVDLDAIARPVAGAVVLRAGTRRGKLAGWWTHAEHALRESGAKLTGHAHAASGVARLRLESVDGERAVPIVADLRGRAEAAGGYLVIESAPTLWKASIDVWGAPGAPNLALLRGVKAAFDPRRILSAGRFVAGV